MAIFALFAFISAQLIIGTAFGISEIHLQRSPGLTFSSGDSISRIESMSYLYYANISIGTPPVSYMVALDTESSISWLPCDCDHCPYEFTGPGLNLSFSHYSPRSSSTSSIVECHIPPQRCVYNLTYWAGTHSNGVLMRDVLHLSTYDIQHKSVDAEVIFGCGMDQRGAFLYNTAVNGLLGLAPAVDNVDFLGTLASQGIVGNSFSLCFSFDGHGRLVFGDKGSPDQGETPFVPMPYEGYHVGITQVAVNRNVSDVNITVIFDAGTASTYLSEPAYSFVTTNLDALIKDPHFQQDHYELEYCYSRRPNQTSLPTLPLKLTMRGGNTFHVLTPMLEINPISSDGHYYCLGIIKSSSDSTIGQNFMTGYHWVFDREKNILGWKQSHCKANQYNISTYPVNGSSASTSIPILTSVGVVVLVYCLALHM